MPRRWLLQFAPEGDSVIGPTGEVKDVIATKPVDFRKGAEGLAELVRETMGADPMACVQSALRRNGERIR
ncbi:MULTISPECIES: IS66 family insertion sequence element accessory protein TnpB [unclassified Mesorhizobium]|uniref:IS66 family insertion sequence element accessory protein TnpB n=1 Tax=unclassified Mesorhizobium TaxID=325217 RepID=UPI0018DEB772|nr:MULTISPECIES: IS66 family insertion sequence element accessory protein TnpB [unclassified Mesorhizobium]WJI54495.1 transposase [Mesorhizobium sp. C089B]